MFVRRSDVIAECSGRRVFVYSLRVWRTSRARHKRRRTSGTDLSFRKKKYGDKTRLGIRSGDGRRLWAGKRREEDGGMRKSCRRHIPLPLLPPPPFATDVAVVSPSAEKNYVVIVVVDLRVRAAPSLHYTSIPRAVQFRAHHCRCSNVSRLNNSISKLIILAAAAL